MAAQNPFLTQDKKPAAPTAFAGTSQVQATQPANKPAVPIVEKEKTVVEKPKILELAEKDLLAMIEKIQSNLDSLKTQKSESVDTLELLKLSCAKVLREATHKVIDLESTVSKMETLSHELEMTQKGMSTARETIEQRSSAFRRERDAFLKMRSMTEKEFYALVAEVEKRTEEEKNKK